LIVTPRRTPWLFVLAACLAAAVIGVGWNGVRTALIVRRALPPPPRLATRPAELVRALAAATRESRSLFRPAAGLAQLARLYHANGFYPEALRCYRTLARIEPAEPRWPHLIATIESTYGRLAEAIPWERRAVHLAPTAAMARLRLGAMLLKSNQLAEAEAVYEALHRIAPDNAHALLGLARCRLRREDERRARDLLGQALAVQPDLAGAWALLSSLEEKAGHRESAEAARRRSETRVREMADPWAADLADYCYDAYQLSVAADVAQDPQRGCALLRRAIALAPSVGAYHHQIAKLLIERHEKDAAREELERAVELAPTDSEAWSTLITLLLETKDQRAGLEALARALRLCPDSGYLHFLNGNRLMSASRYDEAIREFETAKRLHPAEIRSYIQLSRIYVITAQFTKALAEARQAIAADPANITVLNLLARLSIMIDDRPAAETWVEKLRTQSSADPRELAQVVALFRQQYGRDP
jgi:HemY protein